MTQNGKTSETPTRRLYALWQPSGPKCSIKLRKTALGDFPDAVAAASFLQITNPAVRWQYLFCYRLEPVPEYRGGYSHPISIFDRDANLRGGYDHDHLNCFPGRKPEDCRYKSGDVVMFREGDCLVMGVVEELPPDPDFAKQVGEESGLLDEVDDSYLVSYAKGGRRHNHLPECELFPPEAPIPNYLLALQKKILAGWGRNSRLPRDFYQKGLFLNWMVENRQLFSHEPYLAEENQSSFTIRFKGITKHISCCFTDGGDIMVTVDYRNQFYDIIMECDLYEEETPEGRYLCSMCRDWPNPDNLPEVIEYENRAELWIKHSFEKLAAYTRDEFTNYAVLGICRYGGSTAAFIATGEKLEKLRKREDFFIELPVVVKQP